MAAAADPNVKIVQLRVVGGELPGATLAQKVGPLGLSAKVVGEDIKKATAAYKSLKVAVRLTIVDRKATVEVVPSTTTLVLKALNEPPRDRKKEKNIKHSGSLKMMDVVEISRKIRDRVYAKNFANVVKTVLGTCLSVGCKVDGESPKVLTSKINNGEIALPDE